MITKKTKATGIDKAVSPIIAPPIDKVAKRLGKKREPEPVTHVDPRAELRRLVQIHKALTKKAVAIGNMASDRKWKDDATGEIVLVPSNVPEHRRVEMLAVEKGLRAEARALEAAMRVQLKTQPVFREFLRQAWGICGDGGAVTAAYIVAMVDIERCPKVSNLIRYCGFATDTKTGRSERRGQGGGAPKAAHGRYPGGGEGTFNNELKIKLVVAFMTLWKSGVRKDENDLSHQAHESKYLKRWIDAKHTALTLPNVRLGRVMHAGEAHDKGRRKATDLFLWDLYVVWRAIEGLPIWADKYATARGAMHGGGPAWIGPRDITLDEALEMIGLREVTQAAAE